MTIIDYMRQKLTEYPKISEFLAGDDIHIDFTEPDPVNYGLSSTGDALLKEDVLGNQIRQHNFTMYAVGQSFTDYNRIAKWQFPSGAVLLAGKSSGRVWHRGKYQREGKSSSLFKEQPQQML